MSAPFLLSGHEKDLGGGFVVRRLLPAARRRNVGPFIFFDHFGPVTEQPGDSHDVRPHPHIGLATVTYLFEGAMMHRDSLGTEQLITPGALNWMVAGRGIVHSERKPLEFHDRPFTHHGLQLWCALPVAQEACEPSFTHLTAEAIPQLELAHATVRVLAGEAFGLRSPLQPGLRAVYLDVMLAAGAELELPALAQELAVYPVEGGLRVDGLEVPARSMAIVPAGEGAWLAASAATRLVVVGGEPLDAPRHLWWNFVSSRPERILEASQAWEAQRMGQVPGETEFIPLPQARFAAAGPRS